MLSRSYFRPRTTINMIATQSQWHVELLWNVRDPVFNELFLNHFAVTILLRRPYRQKFDFLKGTRWAFLEEKEIHST